MKEFKNNEKGYVLIGVIATFVILSILSLTMITLSAASFKTSTTEKNNQSAFYIAEAGLNYQEQQLKNKIIKIYEANNVETEDDFIRELSSDVLFPDATYDDFEQENAYAELSVEKLSDYQFKIYSKGYVGKESRSLSRVVEVEWQDKYQFIEENVPAELPPFAVFTSGSFSMKSGTINGDIASTETAPDSVVFHNSGPNFNGEVYVKDENINIVKNYVNEDEFTPSIKLLDKKYTVPELPEFPQIPEVNDSERYDSVSLSGNQMKTIEISELGYFEEVKLQNNTKLTLDIGNQDTEIIVDKFDIENGHIYIKGEGNLTLYIVDYFNIDNGSTINQNGKVKQLNIFMKNNIEEVTIDGSQKINASLYAENANIYLTAGGGFKGNIFTGGTEFSITGGSSNNAQLFFAPNAHFKVKEGGKIRGKIIAEKFKMSGGGSVTFEEIHYTDGPISPSALNMENSSGEGSGGGTIVEKISTGNSPSFSGGSLEEND